MQLEEEEIFIDLCLETPVWAATWEFISGNGKKNIEFPTIFNGIFLQKIYFPGLFTGSFDEFRSYLIELWFGLYARGTTGQFLIFLKETDCFPYDFLKINVYFF